MSYRLLSTSPVDVEGAADVLRSGGLVAFPTETVYGLGANALDASAVARVFEAKQRPHFDPLIVHVATYEDVSKIADEVTPLVGQLMDVFWPGPLTLILPKALVVPGLVTSGLDTVAVRMPSHPVAIDLIERAGVPVAAPSANPFGRLSPVRAQHVVDGLGDAVDVIIDGGTTTFGVESTIVDASDISRVRVLRQGAVSEEELEEVLGDRLMRAPVVERAFSEEGVGPMSPTGPGQMPQHYAPRTRLVAVNAGENLADGQKSAFLAFSELPKQGNFVASETLSPNGDVREAAANLFDALHRLDHASVDVIYVEWVPDVGVGRAINDRLRRAAATWSAERRYS